LPPALWYDWHIQAVILVPTDVRVDLIAEQFDAAILVSPLRDSPLIAHKL
jgi:DNA-binding transcriptional LysR family regulator